MAILSGYKLIEVPGDTSEMASRPERLVEYDFPVDEVELFAKSDNTASVWIGGPEVSATPDFEAGVELAANDSYTLVGVNLYDIWIAGTTDGDGVTWNAIK